MERSHWSLAYMATDAPTEDLVTLSGFGVVRAKSCIMGLMSVSSSTAAIAYLPGGISPREPELWKKSQGHRASGVFTPGDWSCVHIRSGQGCSGWEWGLEEGIGWADGNPRLRIQ